MTNTSKGISRLLREYHTQSTFRPELEPFVYQRIPVQGVLVDIVPGTAKTKGATSLVFASIIIKHHNIEVDHVVFHVPKTFQRRHNLELFTVYSFTAKVTPYLRKKRIPGVRGEINARNYQLVDINDKRFKKEPFESTALSKHLILQARHLSVRADNPLTYNELSATMLNKPNDGSREKYIESISKKYQRKAVTHHDTLRTLTRGTKYA